MMMKAITIMTTVISASLIPETTPWSEWGDCSVTCGLGTRRRDRECLAEATELCLDLDTMFFENIAICDKGPCCMDWSVWGECCVDIETNRVIRTRQRGQHCKEGATVDIQPCLIEPLSGMREDLYKEYPTCSLADTTPVVFNMKQFDINNYIKL